LGYNNMPDLKLTAAAVFQPTILLALALMAVIVMMVLPMPAWALDLGLALSFALAILMLTVTLFIERPLDFSAFPTILLASLMLRLSLNISSTKLIIGEGHTGTDAAGHVIQGFAEFIMGGNLLLGVVIFCVLLIVNFVVITKGAGRMAEVGARFALDGMPGKQLAIDADMAAGAIDHAEAKRRREMELAETTFFGSLDGASKFVKGDAVAGLLITGLNMVMGLIVGVVVHGMPMGQAFETYAILTVGDGLVSQIPAVIISVAAALLLSRGGGNGAADVSFFAQLGRYPGALGTVAVLMSLFALVPGMPFVPFILAGAGLGWLSWRMIKQNRVAAIAALPEPEAPRKKQLGDVLDFDEIHIEFAPNLVGMVLDPATGLDVRIANMRSHVASVYGLILPEMRLTDEASLLPGTYRIRLQGVERVRDRLVPDRVLALLADGIVAPEGHDVREPVYGAPARWIRPDHQEDAALVGLTVVSPAEVLATHLLEVIRGNLARLLSLRGLRRLLEEFTNLSDPVRAESNRRLLDELVPEKVPVDLLLTVLRLLLEERVSIRNLPLILEAIAEARSLGAPEAVCEHVRQRLGFQLMAELKREDGTIPLIQLSPEWEKTFAQYQIEGERGLRDVALPPDQFSRLANAIAERLNRAAETGTYPALVTSTLRRRFLRTVLGAKGLSAPVLSYEEIGLEARPAMVGVVPA
jgi:flagellar biosynthesis protein FlhA